MGHYILITISTQRVVSSFGKKKSSRLGRFAQQFSLCIACRPSLVCMTVCFALALLSGRNYGKLKSAIYMATDIHYELVGKAKSASFCKIPFCSYFLMIYLG